MKSNTMKSIFFLLASGMAFTSFAGTPQSVNVIKFSDDAKTLFLGDSKAATIFAYSVNSKADATSQLPYNIYGIDGKFAQFLHTTVGKIIVRNMIINPVSKEVYAAIEKATTNGYSPAVVVVNQTGKMRLLDLSGTSHTETKITDAPTSENFTFWSGNTMRSFTFTDFKLYNNKLYISGLSNAEFCSTMRIVDFPFTNKKGSVSYVAMYHTAHDQTETRAPIRKFDILSLNGKEYMLAAYTCTPLVVIPLEDLQNEAHVTGKTVSELGYGNTPIGIMKYTTMDQQTNKPYDVLLITNKNRSANIIPVKDIEDAVKGDGLTKAIGFTGTGGAAGNAIPLIGLITVGDQDGYHITGFQRNVDNGQLDLISYIKGGFFRVDQFESEFAFPTYKFTKDKESTKQFINFVLKDMNMASKEIK